MKQAYQYTLNEWEALLDRGPVYFLPDGQTVMRDEKAFVTRQGEGCYIYHIDYGNGNWAEERGDTLLELFLLRAIGSSVLLTNVVDAKPVVLLLEEAL